MSIETTTPREVKLNLIVGPRAVPVTIREMTIREMNQWEDACEEVNQKTLRAAIVDQLGDNAILELRNRERAALLPSMLHYDGLDKLTATEYEDLRFSVVEKIFLCQAEVNRRSEVLGETERLIRQYEAAVQAQQTRMAPTNSASEAAPSSDDSGSSDSATASPATTT